MFIIINIVKIAILLGVLIFIHECGHFFIAKLFKIKVSEFAIGFGPTIWKKQGKETKYALRLIPLGGFVNMLGESERSEEQGSFSQASVLKRIAIVVAGGIVNIIFGLALYFILASTSVTNISTNVQELVDDYAAKSSGIQIGDKILKIDNKKIRLKEDVNKILDKCNGNEIKVLVERENKKIEIKLAPTPVESKTIGIYLGIEGENLSTTIQGIYGDSPAGKVRSGGRRHSKKY